MGARLYSPALGRFLQIDPVPGGNASPYDYCTADPVNCTDLDGNWGMPKWLKKTVGIVAVVAEVASMIPGPIGAAAAAVSAVSYAAIGNWAKAAEMAITAVAQTVGAGPVVKVAATAVKTTRAATRVERVASKAKSVYRAATSKIQSVAKKCNCGCPTRNSFTPNTLVLMADQSYRPISEIAAGDLVQATDPETGESAEEPVLDVIIGYGSKHLVTLEMDESHVTAPLTATSNHPVWVVSRGWVEAGQVRQGDQLLSSDGAARAVLRVEDGGDVPDQIVYNLTVGNLHTFSVAADGDDTVVHNCARKKPDEEPEKITTHDNRKPHGNKGSKATRDKHQNADSHGGHKKRNKDKWTQNPNKRKKGKGEK